MFKISKKLWLYSFLFGQFTTLAAADEIADRYGKGVCSGPWQFTQTYDCNPTPLEQYPVTEMWDGTTYYYKVRPKDGGGYEKVPEADGSLKKLYLGKDFDKLVPGDQVQVANSCLQPAQTSKTYSYRFFYIQRNTAKFTEFYYDALSECQAAHDQDLAAAQAAHPDNKYQFCEGASCSESEYAYPSVYYYEPTATSALKDYKFTSECGNTLCTGSYKSTMVARCEVRILEKNLISKRDAQHCGTMLTPGIPTAEKYAFKPELACKTIPDYQITNLDDPVKLKELNLYEATNAVIGKSGAKVLRSQPFLTLDELKASYPNVQKAVCLTGEVGPSEERFANLRMAYNAATINGYALDSASIQQRTAAHIRRYKADELSDDEQAFRDSVLRIGFRDGPNPLKASDFQIQFTRPSTPDFVDGYKLKVTLPSYAEYAAVCLKAKEQCVTRSDWQFLNLESFTARTNVFALSTSIKASNTPLITIKAGNRETVEVQDTINLNTESDRQLYVVFNDDALNSRLVKVDGTQVTVLLASQDSVLRRFALPSTRATVSADGKHIMAEDGDIVRIFSVDSGAEVKTLPNFGYPVFKSIDSIQMIKNGEIRNMISGESLAFPTAPTQIMNPVFSSDRRYMAQTDEAQMKIWDLETASLVVSVPAENSERSFYGICKFNPKSPQLYCKNIQRNFMHILDVETREIKTIPSAGSVWNFEFTADGQALIYSHANEILEIMDATTGALIRNLLGTPGKKYGPRLVVSRNGLYVIASNELFSLEPGKERLLNSITPLPKTENVVIF